MGRRFRAQATRRLVSGFADPEKRRVAPGLLTVFATRLPRSCTYSKYVKLLLFLKSTLENVPCFNAPEDEPVGYFAQ